MAPCEVIFGSLKIISAAEKSSVILAGTDITVDWSGDNEGKATIFNAGRRAAEFPLTILNDTAKYAVKVDVPPIEKGEKPTTVNRDIILRRI